MVSTITQTHRHTDRQTDRQTDLICVLECNAAELSNKVREEGSKGVALPPHSYGLHHPCVAQLLHNKLRVKHERLLLLIWLDTPTVHHRTVQSAECTRTHMHAHHTLTGTHTHNTTHTHNAHTHARTHTRTHTHSAPYEMWRSCTKSFHQQLQRLSEVHGYSLSPPPSSPSLSLLPSLLHGVGFRLLSTNGGSPKCGHFSDSTCLTAHCKEETDHMQQVGKSHDQ